MNVGNLAAHLALFGLETMVTNEGSLFGFPQPKWLGYEVAAISGGLGTFLSLTQCVLEGGSPSRRTKVTLVMNLATLGYSLKAACQHSLFRAACLEEFRDFGFTNNPDCPSVCDLLDLPKDQCYWTG